MKHRDLGYQIKPIYIRLWLIVFALILILSINSMNSDLLTLVKLSGIVLCLFFAVRTFPRDYLLLAAMLATCIADLILANDNTDPVGVTVFLATQLLHLIRLDGARLGVFIAIFSGVAATLLALDYIFGFVPILYLAVTLYAIILITNIVVCARWHRDEPENIQALMALAGFSLFACCDFCTSISYLSLASVGILPLFFNTPANFFVWLFYYPSQILISNTGKLAPLPQNPPLQRQKA